MIREFPELRAEHLSGAKLYANRYDLIRDLSLPKFSNIAEVGVALGEFSIFLIDHYRPSRFDAFDLFQIHLEKTLWGRETIDIFGGKSHLEYYRDRLRAVPCGVHCNEGLSSKTLELYPDNFFDLIYIDAAHTYEEVLIDAELASKKCKASGTIVFNDYILYDPFIGVDYGIVPVVNEMIVHEGWKVVGFALQKHLFCDIAVRRN